MKLLQVAIFGISLILVCSCTEQHDPTAHHQRIKAEHAMAERVIPKLAPDGTLPKNEAAAGAGAALSEIDTKYNTFCITCHGPNGDGNTPAGQALKPNPRNFTDAAWQEKTTDERIAQVIKGGGAAVGLSPLMAAWGPMLSDALIKDMVGKIRAFKKK